MTTGFLRHIAFCTQHDATRFLPFRIEGRAVGAIRKDYAPDLTAIDGFALTQEALTLTPETHEARTTALAEAAARLAAHHGVALTREIYPIVEAWDTPSFASIDRAAIPWFGTRGFGVHVNGFVRKADGLYLWVARRAKDRRIDPGKLDNMIGGGLPLGYTIRENLCKEAWEEAGLSQEIAQKAKAVCQIAYKRDMMHGLRNDALFVFDLELPENVVPVNTDGEVESFALTPIAEVADLVERTSAFKFNCNLVMMDFFLRHGAIDTASEEGAALSKAMSALTRPFTDEA